MGLVTPLRVEVVRIFPLRTYFPLFINQPSFSFLSFDFSIWGWTLLKIFSKMGLDIPKNDINKKICSIVINMSYSCFVGKLWFLHAVEQSPEIWHRGHCGARVFLLLFFWKKGQAWMWPSYKPLRRFILAYSHIRLCQTNSFEGAECFEHFQTRNSAGLSAVFATSSRGPLWSKVEEYVPSSCLGSSSNRQVRGKAVGF